MFTGKHKPDLMVASLPCDIGKNEVHESNQAGRFGVYIATYEVH